MEGLILFAQNLAVAVTLVSILFAVAVLRGRRYDLIDVGWGLLFIAVATYSYVSSDYRNPSGLIFLAIVVTWGLRLAVHIFGRWHRSSGEDQRYVELRSGWPKKWIDLQMFVRVYLVQALLACIVSFPIMLLMSYQPAVDALVVAGLMVWAAGFCLEVVADRQLSSFLVRSENKGKLMTAGVWRYSRHPNYFGEIVLWWGIALCALTAPYGWLGMVGTLTITLLIMFVSGVPPAERRAALKPGWLRYKQATSRLVPMPPRRSV